MDPETAEIIDLTDASPTPPNLIDLTSDHDEDSIPSKSTLNENGKKKNRKRKKKKLRTAENDQASATVPTPTENMLNHISRINDAEVASASTSASRRDDASQFYFIDLKPIPLLPPPIAQPSPEIQESQIDTLLLPAHVAVFGNEPIQIVSFPQKEFGEEDYIEYLAYDDHKDTPRYFEDQNKEENNKVVCKNCGAEGDHKASACPVIVCLTCGAHNEHTTRSCPISKVCFTCGMKGHINATCPNRYTTRGRDTDRYVICERCDSRLHKTNECPSWWRLYEYVADEERSQIVELRKGKKDLQLGSGGEAYIGCDPWCYNCACMGHWGDDCDELPHRYDRPEEPSAFSLHNVMLGPFYDPEKDPAITPKAPRSHRRNDETYDDWLKDVPSEVGKQGRRKNMARLEKRAQEQEQAEENDWFNRPRDDLKIRGRAKDDDRRRDEPRKASKISFGKSVAEAGRRFGAEDSKQPSLLSRIGDDRGGRDRGGRGRNHEHDRYYDRHDKHDREDRDRRRRHGRDRESEYGGYQNRPRYKGGYMR